jgi:tetratricopeptide (TPR) repeat protein
MQFHYKEVLLRTAAFSLAALVLFPTVFGSFSAQASDKTYSKGEKALRRGDYEQAEKIFRELLVKDSKNNEARLGLSFALLKQRSLQDAYDHAARVLMIDPLSARAHALLGSAILASGNFRNSVEEFRTALVLKNDEALAIAGLAMVDFYENRVAMALPKLRKAMSLDPDEPDYVFNLGQAAARSEKYKEAADAYERFLLIAPKADADRRARIAGLIDFLRYLGRQGQLYVAAGQNRTSVSFEAVDTRPILRVKVNGQKQPLRFVIDTGSGMSVVSDVTAKKLGLSPIARGGLARAVGGGGRFEIIYGFLSSIEIGEVKVENIPVYIRRFFDSNVPVDGSQSDNVEGWATLRQRQDFPASMLPSLPNDSAIEIPLRTTSSGFLSGEVSLEGFDKTLNFIIDTAASISVVSEKLSQEEQLLSLLTPSTMRVYGAAGVTEDVKLVQLPKVGLGSNILERVNAAVLDLEPVNETAGFTQSGILGGNFLKHFRLYFDFARGAIRLEPLHQKPKVIEASNPDSATLP